MPRVATPQPIRQCGVIPYRLTGGVIEILLVTTRGGQRWLIPKGHLEVGLSPQQSAVLEAFEEGGVRGILDPRVAASFLHEKAGIPRVVALYPLAVTRVLPWWPERRERQRRWVNLVEAERLVYPPGLARCLRAVGPRLAALVAA